MANDDTEELRLALVMNGGVSLAVWMGGVTNEIARLVCTHQQDEIYASLLHMTNSRASVDVISGTSAGGVNGAALSVAMVYKGQFARLRDVWLTVGSFAALLRQPVGKNPGSLLDGNGYFLPEIKKGLAALVGHQGTAQPAKDCPLDLRLTTTLLQGEPGRYVDDLGTPINDVNHRAYFHFQHRIERSDFLDAPDKLIASLAKAARSTASFPFAFEPASVNADDQLKSEEGQTLQGMRFVVDGGVLDNKPFRGALQAIFSMPRKGGVRRVLAYVNPDPGSDAQRSQELPVGTGAAATDTPPDMPALSRVLLASVLGIPQAQSIADQLRSIEQHNEDVRARRDAIVTLVKAFEHPAGQVDAGMVRDLAARLFSVYRTRRLVNTFEVFVWPEALKGETSVRALAARCQQDKTCQQPQQCGPVDTRQTHRQCQLLRQRQHLGKRQRAWLLQAFMNEDWHAWLPCEWPTHASHACNRPEPWQWGMFPVEFSARLMLDVLRRTQALAWYDEATPRLNDTLADLWTQATSLTGELVKKRESEKAHWASGSHQCMLAMQQWQTKQQEAGQALRTHMMAFLATPERQAFCGQSAHKVATVIWKTACRARAVIEQARCSPELREQDRSRLGELALLTQFLSPGEQGAWREPLEHEVQELVYRLLQLEVIEYAFTDHVDLDSDTSIELVQISGDVKSPLGGRSRAAEKLLGLQLGHFAAFYKQSWRANDWLFGRLDGADRLVRILLNPERLYRRYAAPEQGIDRLISDLRGLAIEGHLPGTEGSAGGPAPGSQAQHDTLVTVMTSEWQSLMQDEALLRAELAFVGSSELPLPDHLPLCTRIITTRMHYAILLQELPVLRDAIDKDRAAGADLSDAGRSVLQSLPPGQPLAPEDAARLLRLGLIADERLLNEAGSDLFTRTVGHSLATLQSTLAEKASAFGPVGTFFATLKLPFFLFYLASRVLTRQTRTQAALHGGLLIAGLLMVLAPMALGTDAKLIPPWWQGMSWALFATGMVFSLMRTPRTIMLALTLWLLGMLAYKPASWAHALPAVVLLLVPTFFSRVYMSWLAAVGMMFLGASWSAGYTSLPGLAGALMSEAWPKVLASSSMAFAGLMTLVMLLAVFESSVLGRRIEGWLNQTLRKLRNLAGALRKRRQPLASPEPPAPGDKP